MAVLLNHIIALNYSYICIHIYYNTGSYFLLGTFCIYILETQRNHNIQVYANIPLDSTQIFLLIFYVRL